MAGNQKFPSDLLFVVGFVILTDIFILIPVLNESFVRVVLGLLLLLFLPGYALIALLFPTKTGLEGIERKYPLPPAVEPNIYHMAMEEREKRGLASLPGNLFEAIMETEKSSFVKETLGQHIFDRFLFNKKKEWEEYRIQITQHEIKKYLPLL